MHHSIATSTRKAYTTAQQRYLKFCERFAIVPFPLEQDILCYFAAYLAEEALSYQTIKSYLSGIRHLHLSLGFPDPDYGHSMPRLQQTLRGVRVVKSREGGSGRLLLPITPEILHKIRRAWNADPTETDKVMLWAASTLCFFGFFRAGEITAPSPKETDLADCLTCSDLAVDNKANPTILRVHLKQSKTDPFRRGIDVFVGKTGNLLCPVTAMMAYLARRGDGPGVLFRFQNGQLLTRERFVSRVRQALKQPGIDPSKYAGHSFRSGARHNRCSTWNGRG